MFAAFREGMKNNSHFARPSIWMAALLIVGCSDTKTETVEVPVPGATVTTTVVETVTVEVETTSLDFGEATVAGSVQFTLTTPPTIGADLDTNTTDGDNDTPETAQAVQAGTSVSGYSSEADSEDWYAFTGASGQSVLLSINGDGAADDLDLQLFKEGANGLEFVDGSFSVTDVESVSVNEAGEYFLQVIDFQGEAGYLLSIEDEGSQSAAVNAGAVRLSSVSDANCDQTELCSQIRAGEWVMSTSSAFRTSMKDAPRAEISAAQEEAVNGMGMTITGGAGTMLMQVSLPDNTIAGWTSITQRLGIRAAPWSSENDLQMSFAAGDKDANGVPDQQELFLTVLVAKSIAKNESMIKSAGLNYVRYKSALPNDDPDLVAQQFASHYSLIKLEEAWDSGITNATGSEDVIVAVLDTGIVPVTGPQAHPDWADVDTDASDATGKLRFGYDFVSIASIDGDDTPGIDPDATDIGPANATGFHGSHVAGTVAAPTNNGIGVAGVGGDVSIMPIRVLGNCGCGSTFDILQGNLYAAGLANGSGIVPAETADIINMSLGGGGFNQAAQDVYVEVRAAGVIIVAAAGNDASSQLGYPASYEGVVSVSAAAHGSGGNPEDAILASYSTFGTEVDVSAPGGQSFADNNNDGFNDGVLSTIGSDSCDEPGGYATYNGTSMATPHVAGVAALMESVHAGLTPDEFDQALADRTIVLDIGDSGRDDLFGAGLIDTLDAVRAAECLAGISPTPVEGDDDPCQPAEPVGNLAALPNSLNFGSGLTSVEVEFRNSGDAEAPVTIESLSISSELFLIAAGSEVADNGLGSYMITVDRTDLPEGTSEFTLEVASNVSNLSVPISIRNVPPAAPLNAGPMHIILLDASSLEQTSCALVSPVDGVYSANFDSVPSGDYFALAGSDTDGDGLICGPFEACGAFQSLGDLQQITDADVNFSITYSLFAPFPSGQFGSCD